jgi:PAS domain S-box-containing protein
MNRFPGNFVIPLQRLRGALFSLFLLSVIPAWPAEAALSETMQYWKISSQETVMLGFLLLLAVSFFYIVKLNQKLVNTQAALEKELKERIKTQKELAASEEKYRTLMDNLPIGVYRNYPGEEGTFIEVNNAIVKIFEYPSREEVMNIKFADLYQKKEDYLKIDELIRQNGYAKNEIVKLARKDGTPIYCSLTAKAVKDGQGQILFYDGIIQDITERIKAENEIRKLSYAVEQSPSMTIITDTLGNIVYVNPKFLEVTGYTREEVIGQNPRFLKGGKVSPGTYVEFWNTIARGGEWRGEFLNKKKNGEVYWVSTATSSIKDENGEIQFYIALQEDITQRKAWEAELQEAKKAAEEANKAKSQFLAKMSHELRTPLNAIIGYSEMLTEEAQDLHQEDFIPDLEKIRAAGKHLLALINDILDLSKIEAGKMGLYLEKFNINTMLHDVVSTSKPLFDKNQNQLVEQYEEGLGEMFADVTKIRQILFNLLSNASKFTDKGTITLKAFAEGEGADKKICFRVSDTGIGMTQEQIANLFRDFVQADTSTTRKYGGTGLGLSISKRFCEMMGGNISVESEMGKGSAFTARIPVEVINPEVESPKEAMPPPATKPAEPPQPDIAGKKDTILVIDDDPVMQDIMRRTLQKDGFHVVSALSGEEGIRLAKEIQPMAITLDVMMPNMDGWSVLTVLKSEALCQNIPVIMLSIVDDKSMGYALGADDYLTKPVDKEQVIRVLNQFRTRGKDTGKILVVEDDLSTRELLCRTISKEGYLTTDAENGVKALEALQKEIPDLILLDLMMPVMDGFQFLAEMKKNSQWATIPVVVITAKELTQAEFKYLKETATNIIQKGGYTQEELLSEIQFRLKSISKE